MHHARAEDFEPAGAAADGAAGVAAGAGEAVHRHLHPRLHEREVGVAQHHLALAPEQPPRELQQRPLEVGQRHALVHRQQLHLLHHPLVRRVRRLVAVAASRHRDPQRRLVRLHVPHLHRRGVRPQQQRPRPPDLLVDPEGVPHVARRMVLRYPQPREVVLVQLHLGPLDHREAHAGEGAEDVAQRLRHRMEAAPPPPPPRQRHVERPLAGLRGERGGPQRLAPSGERRLQLALERVGRAPRLAALPGRQRGDAPQHRGQRPRPPQRRHPPRLERRLVPGRREPGARLPRDGVEAGGRGVGVGRGHASECRGGCGTGEEVHT